MFDKDRFVDDCRRANLEHSPRQAVSSVVEEALARPADLAAAFPIDEAGLTPLYRGADLTIIHFVWAPRMTLYPHDHHMWAIIGIYGGREDNTFYRRTGQRLAQTRGMSVEAGQTIVLGERDIHAVANPLRRYTTAIHVYGGDFFSAPRREWDPETLREQPFDFQHLQRCFAEANARAARPQDYNWPHHGL